MSQNKDLLLQVILDSPHCIFWKDVNLVYSGCSKSFARSIGFDSPDDIIGKTDRDLLFDNEFSDDFYSEDMKVINKGESIHNKKVIFFLGKGKGVKTFIASKTPLFSDGSIVGVLCNCYEISTDEERHRVLRNDTTPGSHFSVGHHSDHMKHEKYQKSYIDNLCHYYEAIIACMPGNIYWLNKDCVLMGGNDNLAKMFGLKSRRDLVGLTYEMMSRLANWTDGQGESFKAAEIEVMSTGMAKFNIEEPPVTINGEKRYYLGNKVPIRDQSNSIVGVVGVSIDITDKVKIQKDLVASNKKALIASKSKSDFISNMSHDLRTPITGMLGMAQDMINVASQVMDPSFSSKFDSGNAVLCNLATTVIRDSQLLMGATTELLRLSNDVLDVVKIESGESSFHIESFHLRELVNNSIELLQPTAKHKKLNLSHTVCDKVPQTFFGLKSCLYRILLNLISNALKFTDSGSVTVSIDVLVENIELQSTSVRENLVIKIIDTGIGIPNDKFETIFENFSRLTASYQGLYKGAGMGLYMVKHYVEKMHGKVDVSSDLGVGTCFSVTLPVVQSDDPDPSKLSIPLSQHCKPPLNGQSVNKADTQCSLTEGSSVLIVEDNSFAATALSFSLKSFNCHVDIARNGSEAVSMAGESTYDLILMDIGLPDFSGIEATKRIRSLHEAKKSRVPIVALTGPTCDQEIKHDLIIAGMQDVLSKPALPSDLESVLKKLCV